MKKKVEHLAAIGCLLIIPGLGAFLHSRVIRDRYLHDLPRVPNESERRLYPLNIHGVVVSKQLMSNVICGYLIEEGSLSSS